MHCTADFLHYIYLHITIFEYVKYIFMVYKARNKIANAEA